MSGRGKKVLDILGMYRVRTICAGAILLLLLSGAASAIPYTVGDVFAGVGAGKVNEYTPTGTLVQTLDSTSGSSEQTGMCFNASGNLYATSFTTGQMELFDNNGNLLTYPWGGPFSLHPESCVVDNAGNIYTGEVDGANMIRKFDPSGTTLLASFSPTTESRGLDWIDLAADQKTMFYTSEGSSVKRFDVSTSTQLLDFATGLQGTCFALRIRPNTNGEVMVACANQVYRLDNTGAVMQTYPKSGFVTPVGGTGEPSQLFAMNLDPDGVSFWTAGYTTGNVYRIDISSGAQLTTFTAAPNVVSTAGLAVFGELTAAAPKLGSISGMKFNDLNGNGANDAEPGLQGWTITLSNQSGIIATITTDNNGNYNFTNLTADNYTVGEVLQAGWTQTAPQPVPPGTYTVNLTAGENVVGKDFGNFKLGEVDGQKFEDFNANGIKDNTNFISETGLAGWNITINGTDTITKTTVNMTVTTDANGNISNFLTLSRI